MHVNDVSPNPPPPSPGSCALVSRTHAPCAELVSVSMAADASTVALAEGVGGDVSIAPLEALPLPPTVLLVLVVTGGGAVAGAAAVTAASPSLAAPSPPALAPADDSG